MAGHAEVEFPFSKLKMAIVEVITSQDFLGGAEVRKGDSFDTINVKLKYRVKNGRKVSSIACIKRVSKEGQRIYIGKEDINQVRNGYGFSIISTSKGVLTGSQAVAEGVGGEVICEIW